MSSPYRLAASLNRLANSPTPTAAGNESSPLSSVRASAALARKVFPEAVGERRRNVVRIGHPCLHFRADGVRILHEDLLFGAPAGALTGERCRSRVWQRPLKKTRVLPLLLTDVTCAWVRDG